MIGRTQNSAFKSSGLNAPEFLHCSSYVLLHLTCELEGMLFIVSTQCSVLKEGRCLYVLRHWELLFQSPGFSCCIFFSIGHWMLDMM